MVAHLEAEGADRHAALTTMLRRYIELADNGDPVHTWPVR